jgi:cobalt/nickel transport system permease protein
MSGGHRAASPGELYVGGVSPIHRLAPEAKLAGLLLFVAAVAVTPRRNVIAFAVDAGVLASVWLCCRLPLRLLVRRLLVVVPFVAFALFIPFVADGEQVVLAGISLSIEGLWASWNVVIKAGLGATASIILSSTTTIPDVLHGLSRLRVPSVIVSIVGFMVRYVDLLLDQLRRTRQAMAARCHDPRWLWQTGSTGSALGVIFVRTYERGERVHQAMLARGFTGDMPELEQRRAGAGDWCRALAPGVVAVAALIMSVAR